MPIRVRQSGSVSVSSGTQETKDLGHLTWEVLTDGLGEGGTWKTVVAAATSDLQIQLDNIADVSLLVIRTNAKDPTQTPVALDFRKNDVANEIFTVVPLTATKEGHFLITSTGITSLFVTNAGAVDMEITLVAAGD